MCVTFRLVPQTGSRHPQSTRLQLMYRAHKKQNMGDIYSDVRFVQPEVQSLTRSML
jgi:hypothetical protein